MPNPNELERLEQEAAEQADARQGVEITRDKVDRPLPKAEVFDITIDFGPHQAKTSVAATDGNGNLSRLIIAINDSIKPHIKAMLEAEERNHG